MRYFRPLMCAALLLYIPTVLAATLGSLSENLLGPTTVVTQLLVYACYIVGVVFVFMAIAQYKVHRESPKLVPLSTPIMLALFGIILACLPYFSTLFNSGSALEYRRKEGVTEKEQKGLPLPPLDLPRRKGPGDFYRSPGDVSSVPDRPSKPSSRPSKPNRQQNSVPSKEKHWSEDPQYQ